MPEQPEPTSVDVNRSGRGKLDTHEALDGGANTTGTAGDSDEGDIDDDSTDEPMEDVEVRSFGFCFHIKYYLCNRYTIKYHLYQMEKHAEMRYD